MDFFRQIASFNLVWISNQSHFTDKSFDSKSWIFRIFLVKSQSLLLFPNVTKTFSRKKSEKSNFYNLNIVRLLWILSKIKINIAIWRKNPTFRVLQFFSWNHMWITVSVTHHALNADFKGFERPQVCLSLGSCCWPAFCNTKLSTARYSLYHLQVE